MKADADTLFDLIATINDRRRALDAAALWPDDTARSARCRQQSRAQARTVARITRDLARRGSRHAVLSNQDLEGYVDSLIDAWIDDGVDPRTGEAGIPAPPRKLQRRHDGSRNADRPRPRGRP